MAVKIELKRSSVPGKIPTTSSLDLGELALNTYDGRAFLKQQQGTTQSIVELATTAGSGSTVATASFAITSSYALTASFAENFNPNATASYALQALSSSYAASSSYSLTASYASNVPDTASYALQALSSSYALTASYASNIPETASYALQALSSSYALTASYASTASFLIGFTPYQITTGSITASVNVNSNSIFLIKSGSNTLFNIDSNGATTISGSASDLFLIKNAVNKTVLAVSQSGVVVLSVQPTELTDVAPYGGLYFTSSSLFIGVD